MKSNKLQQNEKFQKILQEETEKAMNLYIKYKNKQQQLAKSKKKTK